MPGKTNSVHLKRLSHDDTYARAPHVLADLTPPTSASTSARSSIDDGARAPVLRPLIPSRRAVDDDTTFPSLSTLGIRVHPDTPFLARDPAALSKAFGGNGPRDWIAHRVSLIAAICATMGGLAFGFDQGLVSITLVMPHFLSDFPQVDESVTSSAGLNKGIMTALLELGAFIGAIFAGFVADRYSRKGSIGLGIIWFVIGSIIQTTSFTLAQLVIGRFIGGVGIGILSSTSGVYVAEVCAPNVRGAFLTLCELSIVVGIVTMFYITYATRHIPSAWSYRAPFIIQIIPAIPLGIGLFFLPFSPRWLASQRRDEECLATLCRLRRLPSSDPRVQAEYITIQAEAVHNRLALIIRHPALQGADIASQARLEIATWLDMFKPGVIRRTACGALLMFFQQFVGINALIYYSPSLFKSLGLNYELQLTMSGVMNIIQLVAVISVIPFLDKVGRRPPLLLGSIGMSVCHIMVAVMIGQYSHDWANHTTQAWVGVGFILAFMFFFGIGWAPVPWSLPAEIHTSTFRAKGVAIATCTNWLSNFIVGLITPPLIQYTGHGAFIFFATFSVLSGLWTWFFCPETKGLTLEQMDGIFGTVKDGGGDDGTDKEDLIGRLLGG